MVSVGLRWSKWSRYTLAALAGALEGLDGVEVSVVDDPKRQRVDLLAYSFNTLRAQEAYAELPALPAGTRTVAGGPHPSARPAEALASGFDWACVGEGEDALRALACSLRDGREPDGVPGIYPRGHPGPYPPAPPVELDEREPFCERISLFSPLEVSRGCPFGCRYCQVGYLLGRRLRHRSLASVERAARLFSRRGMPRMWFLAPNAFAYGSDGRSPRPDRLAALLDAVRSRGVAPFLGTFPSEVRPEFVTMEVLDAAAPRLANRRLSVGAQSGSDRLLASVGRGHTSDDVRRALDAASAHGLACDVDILFGLPGETEEDVGLTLSLMDEVFAARGRCHLHVFMPLPGSPFEGEPPGTLSEGTKRRLGALALAGKVTGAWAWQEGLAEVLDGMRGGRARRPRGRRWPSAGRPGGPLDPAGYRVGG